MLLTSFIVFIIYTFLEGFREGYYWHYKNLSNVGYKFNIHSIFTIQRLMMFILIFIIATASYSIFCEWIFMALLKSFIYCVGLASMFSFIHNGTYYTIRNLLDKRLYTKKWMAQSDTSTAWSTKLFTFRNRTILFVIGSGLVLLANFLN